MITSKQNQTVKLVASLKQKKGREQNLKYVVEGHKMIMDAKNANVNVLEIFATEENASLFSGFDCPVTVVSDAVFKCMSDEVTPQGSLAVLEIPKSGAISSLSRCLLLDRVQDPGNVGTIMRLAAACGIKDVLLIDSADPYSPKAVRSSMSGIYRVNAYKVSEEEALTFTAKNGVTLICADMDGESLFEFDAPEKFCLCVGNEGNGISDNIMQNANKIISIPMESGVESLNVSVATGVTLYTLLYNNKRR